MTEVDPMTRAVTEITLDYIKGIHTTVTGQDPSDFAAASARTSRVRQLHGRNNYGYFKDNR